MAVVARRTGGGETRGQKAGQIFKNVQDGLVLGQLVIAGQIQELEGIILKTEKMWAMLGRCITNLVREFTARHLDSA